jgi:hypothetical protein
LLTGSNPGTVQNTQAKIISRISLTDFGCRRLEAGAREIEARPPAAVNELRITIFKIDEISHEELSKKEQASSDAIQVIATQKNENVSKQQECSGSASAEKPNSIPLPSTNKLYKILRVSNTCD